MVLVWCHDDTEDKLAKQIEVHEANQLLSRPESGKSVGSLEDLVFTSYLLKAQSRENIKVSKIS